MDKLIITEHGIDHSYLCANGFVQRCVSAVHDVNLADARKLARVLNEYYRASGETKEYDTMLVTGVVPPSLQHRFEK